MRGNQCSGFGGSKDHRLDVLVIGDDPIPSAANGYAFPTWRVAIKEAQKQIDWAYERRRLVFRQAHAAGLTYREIGEAAGLSAAGVHKIVRQPKAALDDVAGALAEPAEPPSRGQGVRSAPTRRPAVSAQSDQREAQPDSGPGALT